MSRDVLKLRTQVVGPAVIGRDARRGVGGEGVGNEAGRGAAASGAQAKRLAVALEAGHGQGEPRAGGRPDQRRLWRQASISHAEGTPCLHQFMGWSDFNPRAQARGPHWLGRAQKVLGPYSIRLCEPAGGLARETTGKGAVWLEATVQDIAGVFESGGWAAGLMRTRFFWKEKGGGVFLSL